MRRARRRQRYVHRSADCGALARQGSDHGLPRRYVLYSRRIPASRGQARGHGCRTLRNRTIREEAVLKRYAASMALAIAAVVAAMSLAHADALDDIKKAGKIRIAIDLGVPPYGMTDDKLQPTGLDVATARLLAK